MIRAYFIVNLLNFKSKNQQTFLILKVKTTNKPKNTNMRVKTYGLLSLNDFLM